MSRPAGGSKTIPVSAFEDALASWIEERITVVDEELERELSEISPKRSFSSSGQSATDGDAEDDESIATEMDNLNSVEESVRTEIDKLEGRWRGPAEVKRVIEKQLSIGDSSQLYPGYEDPTVSSSMTDELMEASVAWSVRSDIPSIEITLCSLLSRKRGLSMMNLCLAYDVLSLQTVYEDPSPVLLGLIRSQLDNISLPPILGGYWLSRMPLLGKMAVLETAQCNCDSQKDILSNSQMMIQEIPEDLEE